MKKRNLTPEEQARELLDRARRYCAISEQCESAVRQKLIAWGTPSEKVDTIVRQLRSEDYLDDERYARAYCESKIIGQQWSRLKVLYQLRLKRLPKEAIDTGMAAVDEESYLKMLNSLSEKKMRELYPDGNFNDDPDADRKLTAFLISRGFTMNEINRASNTN